MNASPELAAFTARGPEIKVFGAGNAGLAILEQLAGAGIPSGALVAVNADPRSLEGSVAGHKLALDCRAARGLGSDPERAQAAAEEAAEKIKELCAGAKFVFVIGGLGGSVGTGAGPAIAAAAREAGAIVFAFAILPFEFEGNLRAKAAQVGLYRMKEAADLTITFENQRTFASLDENTSLADTFKRSNQFFADSVLGAWHALGSESLMGLTFTDICALVRERSGECRFAVCDASGPTRAAEVVQKLFAHPLFDGATAFSGLETLAVWISGDPTLGPVEVNRIMEQVRRQCDALPLIMGAAIGSCPSGRLQVGLMAVSRDQAAESPGSLPQDRAAAPEPAGEPHFLTRSSGPRPGSRIVPPPPESTPERIEQLRKPRKSVPRFRQTQLPLEIVSKGRFDKSEPTIHKGEDLDVPTYLRRGIQLN